MEVRDTIDCCNYCELTGFNGTDNPRDFDLHDSNVWNKRAGVLAIAERAGANDDWGHYGELGSVLMTVAWDNEGDEHWEEQNDYYDEYDGDLRHEDVGKRRMESMRRYIRRHGLGTTHRIPDTINPNHGTGICTVIWHVDYRAIQTWYGDVGKDLTIGKNENWGVPF